MSDQVQDDALEMWRPAPGFPSYEVSSLGRVRNAHGTILKPYVRADGYVLIGLYRERRKQVTCYLHRLVCEAFHGPPADPALHAAHDNGIQEDNRAANLIWKPASANLEDKRRHGTHGQGEQHGGARITEAAVVQIFGLRAQGLTLKAIQEQTGVDYTHLSSILRRQNWAHVAIPDELLAAAFAQVGRRRA